MCVQASYENEIRAHLQGLVEARAVDLPSLMTDLQNELRQIARQQRRKGAIGETLSTTALVNEAYIKFASSPEFFSQVDHGHFLCIAARAMGHIVINHARDRIAQKRGAGAVNTVLDDSMGNDVDLADANRMIELADALERLEKLRPRLAQVVQLRYFAGLGEDETGRVLGIDRSTVRRDWLKARGWLYDHLHPDLLA